MPVTIDQQNDTDFRDLTRYIQMYDMPDFAKSAELSEITTTDDNPNLFADNKSKPYQFPCHTKAATYLSYIYFLEKQGQLTKEARDRIQGRLDRLADFYGIRNFTKAAMEKQSAMNADQELSDSDFALVWVTDEGVSRNYPLRNAGEVKAAAAWFVDRFSEIQSEYVWQDRHTIATKILDKAAEYCAAIGEEREVLEKSAGLGVCDPSSLRKHIRNRALLADRTLPQLKEGMEKLAAMIDKPSTLIDPATSYKMAALIDNFDRVNGLVGKYTDSIPSPEDMLFGATMSKVASVKEDICALTTGTVYDRRDFKKLSVDVVKNAFGDEILEEVVTGLEIDPVKFASIAATFPRPDAEILDSLMRRVGNLNEIKFASFNAFEVPEFIPNSAF